MVTADPIWIHHYQSTTCDDDGSGGGDHVVVGIWQAIPHLVVLRNRTIIGPSTLL